MIAPQMRTINDLFYDVAGLYASDRVRLLLELYECYSKLNPKAESLDEFIFWGDVILGDFNDVDKYLVNASQLFTNVADFKSIQDTFEYLTPTQKKAIKGFIDHFNERSVRLTADIDGGAPNVKERFLQIWNILYPLYQDYRNALRSKGMAYEGMVYRDLAEKLKEIPVADIFSPIFPKETEFVFVGLNALNECEKILLRKLRDAGKAQFCWDWSGDMIKDPQNRSSFFMADNVLEFPQAANWDPEGVSVPKINVVSIPSSVGQAKRLPDILQTVADQRNGGTLSRVGSECAVVLPDENLLRPVLNSIPTAISDINVTMGLPMTGSLLYSLMSDLSSVQLHIVNRKEKYYFYHKQVWDVFSSEVFRKVADEAAMQEVARIRQEARHYIPEDDFLSNPLLSTLFTVAVKDTKLVSSSQIQDFAEYQKKVLRYLASHISDDRELALELEYAREYYRSVNVLQEIGLEVLPLTYVRLLNQLLGSISVPFKGEPLKGLQIMGPLETRALDFKDLIIMSANEGVFPRRNVSSSFIPPELRRGFEMPTYEYQDAVWAYYFYRMISRAETVWMLTDSRTEGLKSGEESRYIKQLEYHFGVPLNRYVVRFGHMKPVHLDDIPKTEDDVQIIRDTSLSATTLQNYLACPARFYYSTVKQLRPEEEVAESLDYGMFGTIFHELMRALYTVEGSRVDAAYLKSWIAREDDIRTKVKELIMSELNTLEVSGRNLVVVDVIVRYVMKTLSRDLELLQSQGAQCFKVLGQESYVSGEFCGQKFKGFIDRLDSIKEGQVRVVDYKTGKVLENDENITDDNATEIADMIFNPSCKERPKIALQFFIYDMLLQGDERIHGKELANCVYSTAHLFSDPPVTVPLNKKFYDAMSEHLEKLLVEMYDTEVPFKRTDDQNVCSYCDFKAICGR